MNEQFLYTSSGKIAYFRFGTGPELLIAIPGYGDRAVLFEQLKESLSLRYTVYALQLPLHGESDWNESSFSKRDFAEAIHQIKNQEQKKEVALMGYSFGGRVVCALLESSYPFVKEIYLLAPDGFNQAYIRRATLLPKSFRYALQRLLDSPNWYLWLAKSLHKVGLLKTYSLHFVERNMATAKRRKRLFLFWNSMDDFQYDEQQIAALLEKHHIKTTLILGKEDRVIPTERWRLWGERQPDVKVILLEEGHRVVGGELDGVLKDAG
jgi:pimeloyl-ACP methyl ester carboxylesterase